MLERDIIPSHMVIADKGVIELDPYSSFYPVHSYIAYYRSTRYTTAITQGVTCDGCA